MGELYGEVNRSTLEWKDGLIGMSVRHAVQVSKLVHVANVLAFCNSQSYLLSRYCFRSDWRVSTLLSTRKVCGSIPELVRSVSIANGSPPLRPFYVAQALSHGNGPCHSLHASA